MSKGRLPNSRVFTLAGCLAAPDQPLDPTPQMLERHKSLGAYWMPTEYKFQGRVMFSAPFIPPHIIAMLKDGLKTKRITWEYLLSDAFFYVAAHAATPVHSLEIVVKMMISMERKPSAAHLLECKLASYWEMKAGRMGQPEFQIDMHDCLVSNNLTVEMLGYEGGGCDDLRLFTHRPQHMVDPCGCFHCLKRPYKIKEKAEVWERLRLEELKKGRRLISWAQYEEINAGRVAPEVWDAVKEIQKAEATSSEKGQTSEGKA